MPKGQYRILNEVLLFTIGIAILSFVIISFSNVQENVNMIVMDNDLETVSDIFATGIIKSLYMNSSIRVAIPTEFSDESYIISIGGNTIKLTSTKNPSYVVSKELFNINQNHNIKGDALSSGEFFSIETRGNTTYIRRRI
ncbi:MAG TPA: hypothetical protein VJB11_02765 [archaeon]|nr:hypothetical protein [archaeon]